jgi:hypothetical protein
LLILLFRILEWDRQKTFSQSFFLYNDAILCADSFVLCVESASIYAWYFSMNLCSATCKCLFRTMQKRQATVFWFLFWSLKFSCRCVGCICFAWFSAAHCRIFFLYWSENSSIDTGSFLKFISICLFYVSCKYIQEYNHDFFQLRILEFDLYYVFKRYRHVKLKKEAGDLKGAWQHFCQIFNITYCRHT